MKLLYVDVHSPEVRQEISGRYMIPSRLRAKDGLEYFTQKRNGPGLLLFFFVFVAFVVPFFLAAAGCAKSSVVSVF